MELSVVLLIVGLIIGGVLKGGDLIESARLKSLMSQINEYRVANNSFFDRFNALPGNYANASNNISSQLRNGSGNGQISGSGLAPDSESASYWAHLSVSGLISAPSDIAPTTKMGGYVTVTSLQSSEMQGNWYLVGNSNGSINDGALLTPQQAFSLDSKNDNGNPRSGNIQARDGAGLASGSCVDAQGNYNIKNKNPACVMYFKF